MDELRPSTLDEVIATRAMTIAQRCSEIYPFAQKTGWGPESHFEQIFYEYRRIFLESWTDRNIEALKKATWHKFMHMLQANARHRRFGNG